MDGAGFIGLEGYKEESSTDLCMQYDKIAAFSRSSAKGGPGAQCQSLLQR